MLALSGEGEKVTYGRPFTLPESGIFHPDAQKIFPDFESYLDWYRKTGKYSPDGFWVGIYTFHVSALKERGKIEKLIWEELNHFASLSERLAALEGLAN